MSRKLDLSRTQNVLGNRRVAPPLNSSRSTSKAKKYFKQRPLAPPISFQAQGDEAINSRPPKPIVQDIAEFDPNDPFSQIGFVTDKIGSLVQNYEAESEQEKLKEMQELDTKFQINGLAPDAILDESKNVVDGLIQQSKELKKNQVDALIDLNSWFSKEGNSLRDQDEKARLTTMESLTAPLQSEGMLEILNSNTGTKNDRVSRAMAIHTDIVAKAYLRIHQLEKQIRSSDSVIKKLEEENTKLMNAKKVKRSTQSKDETAKQLEVAMQRIFSQDEQIRKLNARIEQLLKESVLQNVKSQRDVQLELQYSNIHDAVSHEMEIETLETEINRLKDELFKTKHALEMSEANKAFLKTQNFAIEQKLEIETQKIEQLDSKILELQNENADVKAEKKAEGDPRVVLLKDRIKELQSENDKLRKKNTADVKKTREDMQKLIDGMRREFEVREAEIKQSMISSAISKSNEELVNKLTEQREKEIKLMKESFDAKIKQALSEQSDKHKIDLETRDNEITKLKTQLEKNLSADEKGAALLKQLEEERAAAAQREAAIRGEMAAKFESSAADFRAHITGLEEKLSAAENEIEYLTHALEQNRLEAEELSVQSVNGDAMSEKSFESISSRLSERSSKEIEEEADNIVNKAVSDTRRKVEEMFIRKLAIEKDAQAKLEKEIVELKKQLSESQNDAGELRQKVLELQSQMIELEENEKLQIVVDQLKEELEVTTARAEASEVETARLKTENEVLTKQISAKDTEELVTDLQNALTEQSVALAQIQTELATTKKKNKQLQEIADKAEAFFGAKLSFVEDSVFDYEPYKQDMEITNNDIISFKPNENKPPTEASYILSIVDFPLEFAPLYLSTSQNVVNCLEHQTAKDSNDDSPVTNEPMVQQIEIEPPKAPLFCSKAVSDIDIAENISLYKPRVEYIEVHGNTENCTAERVQSFTIDGGDTPVQIVDRIVEKPVERIVEKVVEKSEKPKERIIERVVEKIVERKEKDPEVVLVERATTAKEINNDTMERATTAKPLPRMADTSTAPPALLSIETIENEPTKDEPIVVTKEEMECQTETPEMTNDACQVDIITMPRTPDLALMPAFEIVGILKEEIRPETPPSFDPGFNLDIFEKEERPVQLMTANGDYFDIPLVENITPETDPIGVAAAQKMRVNETQQLSKHLELVVSELQAIEGETDPEKKMQLQKTVGVTLDIEKDSLLSQMRERITELEQMSMKAKENREFHEDSFEIEGTQQPGNDIKYTQTSRPITSHSRVGRREEVSIQMTPKVGSRVSFATTSSIQADINSTNTETSTQTTLIENKDKITNTEGIPTANQGTQMDQAAEITTITSKASTMETQTERPRFDITGQPMFDEFGVSIMNRASSPNKIEMKTEGVMTEQRRVAMNPVASAVPSTRRLPTNIGIVSNEVIDMEPIQRSHHRHNKDKSDLLEKQNEQIKALKDALAKLQSSNPSDAPEAIKSMNVALKEVSEKLDNVIPPNIPIYNDTQQHRLKLSTLRSSIESSMAISSQILDRSKTEISLQEGLIEKIQSAASEFASNLDKQSDPQAAQSEFLRNITGITSDIGASISHIRRELKEDQSLKTAFETSIKQIEEQEAEIARLKDDLIKARTTVSEPDAVLALRAAQSELDAMLYGKSDNNKMFKTLDEAVVSIKKIADKGKNNTLINMVGAAPIIDKVKKMVSESSPEWTKISAELGKAINLLDQRIATQKAQKIISEQTEHIKLLEDEIQKLRTEKVISERDLTIAKQDHASDNEQKNKQIALLNDQIQALERQLKDLSGNKDAAIAAAHAMENERLKELNAAKEELAGLQSDKDKLESELSKQKERFDQLFSQASDAETNNQALRSRVEEILAQSEINKSKAMAMEKLKDEAIAQLDAFTKETTNQINNGMIKDRIINELEAKTRILENKILNMHANTLNTQKDAPRIIRSFQIRMQQYEMQLQQSQADIMSMKAARATDQKDLIALKRDYQRAQSEARIQRLRYESSKKENAVLQKQIASRDETIRLLKREIERLRGLLKMQGPLKQQLRNFERLKSSNVQQMQRAKDDIEKAKKKRNAPNVNPALASYFDNMLRRQQDVLAKLEMQRAEIKEREQRNMLAQLEAVSHLVRAAELEIPEEVIMRYMPRPEESKRVKILSERIGEKSGPEFEMPESNEKVISIEPAKQSYAETLQIIGEMTGRVEPRALQQMMRDARHRQIYIPFQAKRSQQSVTSVQKAAAFQNSDIPGFSVNNLKK